MYVMENFFKQNYEDSLGVLTYAVKGDTLQIIHYL